MKTIQPSIILTAFTIKGHRVLESIPGLIGGTALTDLLQGMGNLESQVNITACAETVVFGLWEVPQEHSSDDYHCG